MIIPIFVPHEGCPNDCAFCNQRTISGKNAAPTIEDARKTIEEYLENGLTAEQIAFFGGSFTGIEKEKRREYLLLAYEYIKQGRVKGIRISTRPDYIDEETVKELSEYGVTNIELGAQSMDEKVLSASKRGHSAEDVKRASEIILKSGVMLGLQMMTGLPEDSFQKCIYTAECFKNLGAEETRIYPTVVLKGTYLEKMYERGEYTPQSVEEAVEISAKLYRFFSDNAIRVLRIGLADSSELKENFVAGAYHPSIGEMVISRDIRNRIEENLKGKKDGTVRVNPRFLSKVNGNKRANIIYFEEKGIGLNVISDSSVSEFKVEF